LKNQSIDSRTHIGAASFHSVAGIDQIYNN
jgi:hypothetical protein